MKFFCNNFLSFNSIRREAEVKQQKRLVVEQLSMQMNISSVVACFVEAFELPPNGGSSFSCSLLIHKMKSRTRHEAKAQALANHRRRKARMIEHQIASELLMDPLVDPRHVAHVLRNR